MPVRRILLACLCCSVLAAETGAETHVAVIGTRLVVSAPTYRRSPEVAKRLAQKITVDFVDTTFVDAVEFLRMNCGVNFVVGNDVRMSNPVITLKLRDVPLAMVLKWMRVTAKVDWHVMDQAVFFTNEPIPGERVVKIYDVADVVHAAPNFPGPQLNLNPNDGGVIDLPPEPTESPYTAEDLAEIVRQVAVE